MYQFHTDHPTPNVYLDVARGAISNSKIVYPWASLSSAQTIYCLSTSASDTTSLTLEGLDANYDEISETVTLTGLTAVTTTNQFLRVFRMTYDATNVGDIEARVTSASGTIVAQIDAGYAQTLMSVYTVPAGHTGYLVALDATIDGTKTCQMLMYHRLTGKPFRIAHIAETEGHYRYDFTAPLTVPEKTDIDIRIDNVSGNDARVTANFDIVLIRD